MAGDDDVDDGGGGDLGVEGLDGNGDGGGGARSDTGTSGAGKTLVKKRITLETDLQKWVTAGSDFIAPKEADGKQVRHVRARGRPRPHPRRARPLLGQAHGRLRAGQDAPDAQVREDSARDTPVPSRNELILVFYAGTLILAYAR
jgi:hypothetical protein